MTRKSEPPPPAMVDVARLAGVSQSCVSLVLNDAPGARLSEGTRQRVRQAAASLGYELPERRPRSRGAGRSGRNLIALMVDEVSISPHAVLHIDGARDAAWAAGCLLQTYVTRSHKELEAETIEIIRRDERVLGVIYATSFTREIEVPEPLRASAVLLLNCYASQGHYPTLLPGEVAGGFAATHHLLGHGHRRIGVIGGEAWMSAARDRLQGYREALATADIGFDPDLYCEGDWTAGSGQTCTRRLMELRNPPTAIFCANDTMAVGCLSALAKLGLQVPDDVSVVGYNDVELARHLDPPLTSCRVPSYDLGRRAVEILIDMVLAGRAQPPLVRKLECTLAIRSSVATRRQSRALRAVSGS